MQSSPSADPNHRTNQNLERAKRASNAQKAFEVRLANRFAKQNFHREFESTGSSLVEDKTRNAKLRSDYYPSLPSYPRGQPIDGASAVGFPSLMGRDGRDYERFHAWPP